MNRRRLFALLALLCMIGFLAVVLYRVPRLDLGGAVVIGLGLAAYDVWSQLFRRRSR